MALNYTVYSTTKLDENSITKVLSNMGMTGVFEKTSSVAKRFSTKDSLGLDITFVDIYKGELEYSENGIEKTFVSDMIVSIRLDKQMEYSSTRKSLIEFIIGIVDISENILVLFDGDGIILKLEKGTLKLSNSDFWDIGTCELLKKEFKKVDFQY
jgi:hypothetical protein